MRSDVTRWKASNGNECFCFFERKLFERPWIVVIIVIVLLSIIGIEYILKGSYYSLAPVIITLYLAFLWWISLPLKANEAVIEETVHEIMDEKVSNDAKEAGSSVIKSFVHYDTKGTYAIITDRYFLVLLDNGIVWEYHILFHKPGNGHKGYYECFTNQDISTNQEHIKAIKPKTFCSYVANCKMSNKNKLRLLFLFILLFGWLFITIYLWLRIVFKWKVFIVIVTYVVLYSVTRWLAKKIAGRKMEIIDTIVSIPAKICRLLILFWSPFITICGTYIFVTIYAFGICSALLMMIRYAGLFVLRPETIVFIVISLGSILCSSQRVTRWIVLHSPLKDWGNHEYETYRERMALYLIHPSNVVFLMYFLYLVFLFLSGYLQIQNGSNLLSKSYDEAILYAFLVFISYNNMRKKAKEADLEVNNLLKMTLDLLR